MVLRCITVYKFNLAGKGELLLSAGEFGMINDEKGSDLWYTVIDI